MLLQGSSSQTILFVVHVLLVFFGFLAEAVSAAKPDQKASSYAPAQAITVSCLNRTIETGEHITDSEGHLQYIPFPTCNETGRPLELYFGVEKDINCTIPEITDPLYHLLEFYIHNDAPLTCRIPTHPLISPSGTTSISPPTQNQDDYIPLIFALAGTLQFSHLHISPSLNVVLHTSPNLASEEADILAATAYSVPSLARNSTKLVIGDPLEFRFSVRWYTTPILPPSTTASYGLGGHVHLSTVFYCLLSAGVGVAGSLAYFRGVELPRRIKRYGKERVGGGGERGTGYAFPGSGAFGMNGYGGGTGKRD